MNRLRALASLATQSTVELPMLRTMTVSGCALALILARGPLGL